MPASPPHDSAAALPPTLTPGLAAVRRPYSFRPMRSPSTGEVEVPFSAYFHLARTGRNPGGKLVEGLRMSWMGDRGDVFLHLPVMAAEVVGLFAPVPPGVVLDATVGGGGHAAAILAAHPGLTIVGLDRDPRAVEAARLALAPFGTRARVVRARFDGLDRVLDDLGVADVSGALFDLGVSSPQLDEPARGFSYRADAPLDMRMDPDQALTAADVVNGAEERDLIRLLVDNGEARFARRIARALIAARPLRTTGELAEVVRQAIPAAARRHGGHPARRVFQAVRIAVNDEQARAPGRRRRRHGTAGPGGAVRGHLVPLRRGPHREGTLQAGGHRRLRLSAGPALRVRRHAHGPPVDAGRP